MAKRTILDMTQDILSKMNSDSVNSIGDTEEATQVAEIVRSCYYDIIEVYDLPHTKELFSLDGMANVNRPATMKLPENISKVLWVKYDTRIDVNHSKNYTDIKFLTPYDFVSYCNARPSTDTATYQTVNPHTNISVVIDKTHAPTFWTSFDDEHIEFDSFDSGVENTMHASKTICEGFRRPTFTLTDTFTPDLPENLFSLLEAQAEAACFAYHKQTMNPKSEERERRHRIRAQRSKWRTKRPLLETPDYGRKV